MFEKHKSRRKKTDSLEPAPSDGPDKPNDEDDDQEDEEDLTSTTDSPSFEWRKKVDPALRAWIMTLDCRRIVADEYFGNPSYRQSEFDVEFLYVHVLKFLRANSCML